jgi:peroxiredoxin
MYPHERSLVERMKDKPFVLLGINSDPKEKLKAALEREKITWPSFWDGGSTGGPIASAWGVQAWPTIYILDAKGVIRYQGLRGEEMDEAVEKLLKEIN